jgi:pyrimidine operon attenuation protein / uracil phosphoribosyltransferase
MEISKMDSGWIDLTLDRLAGEVLGEIDPEARLAVLGVRTRGDHLAARLNNRFLEAGRDTELGSIDVTLYRDDIQEGGGRKAIGASEINFNLDGRTLLLVDDVFYTGRTIRAALTEINDFGRPACIRLLCLLDRGGRELPIRPDYTGAAVDVPPGRKLQLRLREVDGEDGISEC